MDTAELTNAPRDLHLSGSKFQVKALTFDDWGKLQQFIRDRAEDPFTRVLNQFDKARKQGIGINPAIELELTKNAQLEAINWPPRIMTRAWFGLLSEVPGGAVEFLWTLLKTCWPTCPYELAKELESKTTEEETNEIIAAAVGLSRPKDAAPPIGAQGPGPGPGPGPTTAKRSRSKTTGAKRSTR